MDYWHVASDDDDDDDESKTLLAVPKNGCGQGR